MAKGRKSRRLRNKSEDYEQKHCHSCNQPINQNCFKSNKMEGLCGKCYRMDLRECDRRKVLKKQVRIRKQERSIKTFLMSY